jgi:putative membrane protein
MVLVGGFALPQIWGRTLAVTAISIAVMVLYEKVPQLHYSITTTPFTIIGVPLGIFLGFRNNSAYDRFWEGRKLWGGLVNTSRSLARQILTLLQPPDTAPGAPRPAEMRDFERHTVQLIVAYAHALRHHLRDTDPGETLSALLPEGEVERLRAFDNVPFMLLQRLAERVADARLRGWIHPLHTPIFEGSLVSLTDIQGGCERIKATPAPYSYTVLMHRIVAVYCTLLPFGLMETIRWATPFVVLAISYSFFGLDAIGDEIEQPFGIDSNDLPLESISRNIERNLVSLIGIKPPPSIVPKGGVLM